MNYSSFLPPLFLFCLSMFITPGPNNAALMAVSMTRGFRATIPHMLAVTFGGAAMLLLCGLGLKQVFAAYPVINEILKYAGSVYMLWLAWKIADLEHLWRSKKSKPGTNGAPAADGGRAKGGGAGGKTGLQPMTFAQSLLFQFSNPKAWITSLSGVSLFAGTDEFYALRLGVMSAVYIVLGAFSSLVWAGGGSMMSRLLNSDGIRRCNYVFAVFIVLSITLLFI